MKKKKIKQIGKKFFTGLMMFSVMPMLVFAAPSKPPTGTGNGGTPPSGSNQGGAPGSSSSSVTHTGASTISENSTLSNKTYSSTTGGENALLVSGGTSTINDITVNKTGDESSENSDFYGTNAAIFAYNDAVLTLKGGKITTNASHANGVFAYGNSTINISDATINTTGNNSGGVMVTGGGTLNATNLTVKTTGNSAASIRSDRGGGNLTVKGGTYETTGTGSPAIYSTANIKVSNATLTSTSSEGVVVEGANSVTLNNVKLTDTNNTLNGNSQTYKNIFLYQSMSGDADEGNASFTAKDSTITTNKGDTIFVTNTTATINLENNTIVNNDGDFLRIQTGAWGTSGSNGGNVTLNMTNQKVSGNVIVDSISTLSMSLKDKSVLVGSIDLDNQAKKVDLTLSSDSVLSLTADTYVDSLTNEDSSNSNIYSNGKYKLYVDGKEVSINKATYKESEVTTTTTLKNEIKETKNNNIIYITCIIGTIIILGAVTIIIFKKKKNKENYNEKDDVEIVK